MMCGLVGVLSRTVAMEDARRETTEMLRLIKHRGPDDQVVKQDSEYCVGHARLAILDTSEAGRQPMLDSSGRYLIAYNGELYNYKERAAANGLDLRALRSRSDTEVLVELLARYGMSVLPSLNGMFAFALWDSKERELYLCRDRLGIKPLFYADLRDAFYFASEIQPLLRVLSGRLTCDDAALYEFIRWGYINAPLSIAREIRRLGPGCALRVSPSERARVRNFWSMRELVAGYETAKENRASEVDVLEQKLQVAVERDLDSDVPVGCFLSSGVDSTLVAAFVSRRASRGIRAFTIGLDDSPWDEAALARQTASHLGIDYEERRFGSDSVLDEIDASLRSLAEPFGDFSLVPTRIVSRLARESITVAVSGDGGDELFFGYDRYLKARKVAKLYARLGSLRTLVATIARSLGKESGRHLRATSRMRLYGELMADVSEDLCSAVFGRGICFPAAEEDLVGRAETLVGPTSLLPFEKLMMYFDLVTYLPGDNLYKVDLASMSSSLEVRPLLLDNCILEMAGSSPLSAVFRLGQRKYILHKILRERFSLDLEGRPKLGFTFPLGQWFRSTLAERVHGLGTSDALRSAGVSLKVVSRLVGEHIDDGVNRTNLLWRLLVLESWLTSPWRLSRG